MLKWEKKVLNALLDSYERSSLYRDGNPAINRTIPFKFTKQRLPEYFDENGTVYEDINDQMTRLQDLGLVSIDWKGKVPGHIIQTVKLSPGDADKAYAYLGRVSKREKQDRLIKRLESLLEEYADSPITANFLEYCLERVREDKPIKEYVDVTSLSNLETLAKAISVTELNDEEYYPREFSTHFFKDSKTYERLAPKVCKVMRAFGEGLKGLKTDEILERHLIVSKPVYARFKGSGTARLTEPETGETSTINLKPLLQGMAITEKDIDHLNFENDGKIKKVITIENDTTFFHWTEPDSLIVFLGGFANHADLELLGRIHDQLPEAEYLHFGDIDAGGFDIFSDLSRKTGIPFKTYLMDVDTLNEHMDYAKPLTENDRKRIEKMLEDTESESFKVLERDGSTDTLRYMLEVGKKLEQEGVMRN